MKPARPLVLTKEEHALLGELVEIMGLTEHMLIESVARFDAASAVKISKVWDHISLLTGERVSWYTSEQFQRMMSDHGVVCSTSRSGNVWDNAAMEMALEQARLSDTAYRDELSLLVSAGGSCRRMVRRICH